MNIKLFISSLLISLVVLFCGYEFTRAEAGPGLSDAKIGVVNVRQIFRECKRNEEYRTKVNVEQDKIIRELEKLTKEIEADKASLNTLKPGSEDHLSLMKEILGKQARLEAEKEFHKQQSRLKDQQWMEKLYGEILEITRQIATESHLDIVLEHGEPELPAAGLNEFMLTVRTNSVLYSRAGYDITDEVMKTLDARE